MAPSSEVIQDWADYAPAALPAGLTSPPSAGPYTFERNRMEKAVQFVCVEQPERDRLREKEKRAKAIAAGKKVKKDDVEFLTRELLLPKHQAEAVLQEFEGDLGKALKKIVAA